MINAPFSTSLYNSHYQRVQFTISIVYWWYNSKKRWFMGDYGWYIHILHMPSRFLQSVPRLYKLLMLSNSCLRGVACWGNPDDQVSKVLNGWFALAYEEMRASDSGNLFAFCYIIMENQYLWSWKSSVNHGSSTNPMAQWACFHTG